MQFFYIYKYLAHAGQRGYVQPFTQAERLMHIQEAQRVLGTGIPWLCDTMTNDLKHALGNAPTSEFVVDPEGRIVRRRAWGNAAKLRKDLEELVGKVEHPTEPKQLAIGTITPKLAAPRGVVKPIDKPKKMKPLHIELEMIGAADPFYVKLRPQADQALLRSGSGKLYLDFRLDPLYHVHWNNLVAPLEVELEASDRTSVVPQQATAPQPKEPSDVDPREFLVEISDWDLGEPITVTVNYFACNDEEGWCKPVTQRYTVFRAEDIEDGYYTGAISQTEAITP